MTFIVKSKLTGIKESMKALDETRKLHLQRMIQGVAEMARQVYERSQFYVPVSEKGSYEDGVWHPPGKLKESGDWGPEAGDSPGGNFTKAGGVTYSVSYGTSYAIFVHEDMNAIHLPPTGAKFLSRAVQEVVALNNDHIPWRESFGITSTQFSVQGGT